MADGPLYLRSLREFTRGSITLGDLGKLQEEAHGASDRAFAVIMGSIVESSLTTFLTSRLRPNLNRVQRKRLFDYQGPLGTFSAKIIVAYAMQLIGPTT